MSFTAVSGHTTFTVHETLTARVLVIDDDPGMQSMIAEYLESHDMEVAVGSSRSDMTRLEAIVKFDVIVLDLRLGREDGLDLLRELRARSDVPVIIITGHRLEEIDRVVGRKLGANDYLTKPFNLRELLIRIQVVTRRLRAVPAAAASGSTSVRHRFAGWTLERKSGRLLDPSGAVVSITEKECALLIAFLDAPQRPLTHGFLLQATRLPDENVHRSIDVQILRLRRVLENDPSAPRIILTERGVGYVFTARVDTER